MRLAKTTVLLGFTVAAYNLERVRSFKPRHDLNDDAQVVERPSSAGPTGGPGRGPRSLSLAPLPHRRSPPPSSRHQPTAPAVGFSAFWIDEGAEAQRTPRGAVGRAHPPRRPPPEPAPETSMNSRAPHSGTPHNTKLSGTPQRERGMFMELADQGRMRGSAGGSTV
jgi:hypothetical protein